MSLLLLVSLLFGVGRVAASDVIELTTSNFDKLVNPTADDTWLIEFYAPWCGHCKKLAPVYESLATNLKGKVKVAKVDCVAEKDLASRFKVRGYPSLKLVNGGNLYPFRGRDRTEQSLTEFVNGGYKTDSTATPFPKAGETSSEAAAAAAPAPTPKVAVPPPNSDPNAVAGSSQTAAAAATQAAPVVQRVGIKSMLWDAAGAPGKEGRWDGAPGKSDLVRHLTNSNLNEESSRGNILLHLCVPTARPCEHYRATMDRLATTLKAENVRVAAVDCTLERALCDRLEVTGFPAIKLLISDKLYTWTGERSHDSIAQWSITGYRDASATALRAVDAQPPADKSAYAGIEQASTTVNGDSDSKDVVVLTDRNAATLLGSGSGRVFVEFFAPWCGHCKKLKPTWSQLATLLKAENIVVAACDATQDTLTPPLFGANGYPSLRLVDVATKKYYEYKGPRTVDDLATFARSAYKNVEAKSFGALPDANVKRVPPIVTGEATPDATGSVDERDVIVLTDANAGSHLSNGLTIVEFYAPWCGHCKKLQPLWAQFATAVKKDGIKVAKMDATAHTVTPPIFATNGYPSLRAVDANTGLYHEFRGTRTLEEFLAFANGGYKKQLGRPFKLSNSGASANNDAAAGNSRAASAPTTTTSSDGVQKSALWDAPNAPGVKGRWDGSPGLSAIVRNVATLSALRAHIAAKSKPSLLHMCSIRERACEMYRPTIDRLASSLESDGVSVVAIDCDIAVDLCTVLGATKLPDVRIITQNEKLYSYQGARSHDALAHFALGEFERETSVPLPDDSAAAAAAAARATTTTTKTTQRDASERNNDNARTASTTEQQQQAPQQGLTSVLSGEAIALAIGCAVISFIVARATAPRANADTKSKKNNNNANNTNNNNNNKRNNASNQPSSQATTSDDETVSVEASSTTSPSVSSKKAQKNATATTATASTSSTKPKGVAKK